METKNSWRALIALDIRNAFNMVVWSYIVDELRKKKISDPYYPYSHISDRKVNIAKGVETEVTAGIPHESVLGHTLWNVFYDGVLKLDLTDGAEMFAYADDLALLVTAKNEEKLMYRENESLWCIYVCKRSQRLKLAVDKTDVVILKGK